MILAPIALVVLVLKFYRLAFSNELLFISLSTLTMVYMLLGKITSANNKQSIVNLLLSKKINWKAIELLGAGIVSAILVMGILFKLQALPGNEDMLRVGLAGLVLITVIIAVKNSKNKHPYYRTILTRFLILGAISIFLLSLSPTTWIKWRYENYPAYVETALAVENDPTNEELQNKKEEERQKMIENKQSI